MKRFMIVPATTLMLMLGSAAHAQTVRLSWDASPQAEVTGYIVEYGTASQQYTQRRDVGNTTDVALQGLNVGQTYYFAVRAYGAKGKQSPFSNELSTTVKQLTTGLLPGRPELFWRHSTTGEVATWKLDQTNQVSGTLVGRTMTDASWKIVGAGDFNSDNETDVAWQHTDGRVQLWLTRNSTVTGDQMLPSERFERNARIAAVADIDGDGYSDFVWRNATTGAMGVTFMNGLSVREDRLFDSSEVKDQNSVPAGAADFDGDGYADLLWRDTLSGALSVWLMKGVKHLTGRTVTIQTVADMNWRVAALGDVNADGRADIIWQHADARLAAWVMNGGAVSNGVPLNPAAVNDAHWRIGAGR